jgi:hypothetical protein
MASQAAFGLGQRFVGHSLATGKQNGGDRQGAGCSLHGFTPVVNGNSDGCG